MLKIFNSLTGKKEKFVSIYPGKVRLYVCGITVYDLCHLGHARTFIIFDIIVRYFQYLGYEVNYIRNITDIDDKIIFRANKNGECINKLTNRMINEMRYDFNLLNIQTPNNEPRTTSYIDDIIFFIREMINKNYAYVTLSGEVFFSLDRLSNYGLLSKRKIGKFKSNINNRVDFLKKNIIDFVLWKKSKIGEPEWSSPWGQGRPGWHVECFSMSCKIFNGCFDIHGGGSDLIFPHHENEVAQYMSLYNRLCVNFWIHSGILVINNKKMSKSLNNFFTIREILKMNISAEVIRFFLLSTHYRKNLNFSFFNIKNSRNNLIKLYISLQDIYSDKDPIDKEGFISEFFLVMNDDFNVPAAFSILFKIAKEINRFKSRKKFSIACGMAATLKYLGGILGILYSNPISFLRNNISIKETIIIEKMIKSRCRAREEYNWDLADKIRNQLNLMGVKLNDTAYGTTWSIIDK